MNKEPSPENFEDPVNRIAYQPLTPTFLFADITVLGALLNPCFEAVNNKVKRARIQKLLEAKDWIELYKNKSSGKRVLAESASVEFKHELDTAKSLTQVHFDVIFAPKGLFIRTEKKFDVFLLKEHVILKADLKSISSKNPDTISNRIKEGANQASRVVIDILSDIDKKNLIAGLRSGVFRSKSLVEVFLFYRSCFYILPKNLVESKRIYEVVK